MINRYRELRTWQCCHKQAAGKLNREQNRQSTLCRGGPAFKLKTGASGNRAVSGSEDTIECVNSAYRSNFFPFNGRAKS